MANQEMGPSEPEDEVLQQKNISMRFFFIVSVFVIFSLVLLGAVVQDSSVLFAEVNPLCGNGIVDFREQCDDGNLSNVDACTTWCTWKQCGDSIVYDKEECDDGGTCDGGPKNGLRCLPGNAGLRPDMLFVQCGVAVNDRDPELYYCTTKSGDGCSATCKWEPPTGPVCGNGKLETGEQCDDGNRLATDACNANCKNAICGDGVIWNGYEDCDDGNTGNGDGCSSSCRWEPQCGDGRVETGEQCDDGNYIDGDGCSAVCKRETSGSGICGNGVINTGEQCDDGNRVDTDACANDCKNVKRDDDIVQKEEYYNEEQVLIQQLLDRITFLRAEIAKILTQRSGGAGGSNEYCYQINNNLYPGMANNNEVKCLQQFLKKQGIYTGLIGGNYGPLTKAAVVNFQKKYLVPLPLSETIGNVDSTTRAKINQMLISK